MGKIIFKECFCWTEAKYKKVMNNAVDGKQIKRIAFIPFDLIKTTCAYFYIFVPKNICMFEWNELRTKGNVCSFLNVS